MELMYCTSHSSPSAVLILRDVMFVVGAMNENMVFDPGYGFSVLLASFSKLLDVKYPLFACTLWARRNDNSILGMYGRN